MYYFLIMFNQGAGVTWTTHMSPHVNKDKIILSVKCQDNSVWHNYFLSICIYKYLLVRATLLNLLYLFD